MKTATTETTEAARAKAPLVSSSGRRKRVNLSPAATATLFAVWLAACGGSPTVDGDGTPDEGNGGAGTDSSTSVAEPTPVMPSTGPAPEPDIVVGEPETAPVATEPPPMPAEPCATVTCNPGQRCTDDGTVGMCVDNTCADLQCTATELCEAHAMGGFVCVDNGCSDHVDCAPEEFCGESGTCEADTCVAQTLTCVDQSVLACSSSGSSEETLFMCGSPAYFTSECQAGGQDTTGCSCEDDWDCPAFTVCEVNLCKGTGKEPSCTLPPVAFADTPPRVEIHWGGDSQDNDLAHDGSAEQTPAPWPTFSHIQATPMVANLDDDNGDGLINELDFPEIVFVTYPNDDEDHAILRAIHGGGPNKGKDMFAVCGDTTWHESAPFDTATAPCTDVGAELPSRNTLAIGDLDGDGAPEIVYSTSTGTMRILNNAGSTVYLSAEGMVEDPISGVAWGTTPSIAEVNQEGLPEIIFGREVYVLNISEEPAAPVVDAGAGVPTMAGQLYVEHHLTGTGTRGQHGDEGPTSCVADVHADPGQEILAGTTLYRMPALAACATPPCEGTLEVVWDANALNPGLSSDEGYCAVADVWGADPMLAPGPDNPLDGAPEAILVADGVLQIFDAATGTLILERDLEGGQLGGAPNIDDFDGDGFMEIASALESFYVVVDLQDPVENCPAWPGLMDRLLVEGQEDNPNITNGLLREPGGACTADADCGLGSVCNTRSGQCVCLHNGWQRESDDNSSRVTSSSVFDFNGDGAAEVLYNDECEFRVFDGVNGEVLYNEVSRSRTAMENPIVADVDNDGNAEVVTILNTETNDQRCNDDPDGEDGEPAPHLGPNGLRVWGDPLDSWVSARRIWNQFAYHVTNVTEGGSIPLHEPESWQQYNGRIYNTYRSQPRNFGVAPDLQVTGVSLSSPDVACGELGDTLEIAFEITNAGDLRVGPGVEVSFYGVWDDMEAALMGPMGPLTFIIQGSLEPGRSMIGSVIFDIADQAQATLPVSVRVEVDTGGAMASDFGAERECIEDNNDNAADVVAGEPRPDLSIAVGEARVNCQTRVASVDVVVTNSGTTDATGVIVEIFAGDPGAGGTSMIRVPLDMPIAAGGMVSLTIDVPGFPQNRSITLWGVVDPDNTIVECNEADNADPADNPIQCNVRGIAR